MKRLLNAYEVAEILQCHYRHVHVLRKRGVLPAIDITADTPEAEESRRSRMYRFDEDDVRAYIDWAKSRGPQ